MDLPDINIQYRVIIGISAMVLLFSSFLISFIFSERKKLQYHKDLQTLHEQQKEILTQQNLILDKKVQERTAELVQQKEALQHSLSELKLAQSQLIQREKMASLGELTAGIAHEIQNPLNFVNNFSEINAELLAEMKDHLSREKLSSGGQEQIDTLSQDLSKNLEKIISHGKRADSIVKGMLQHARSSAGSQEPTDINALCAECIKLSYQGIRARDKSFNANTKTNFDPKLGKINIIPQEIARVLLNLLNNAFYAVDEKKKTKGVGFESAVFVETLAENGNLVIRIRDNGNGIPEKILDKIFHPFFTTKPAGQGTGLGLSLSYDIVKAAGGQLKVETREGEFTEFSLLLPGT
ncbi:MAG TPA: ATP-binding protein [Puia sp.]|nr:ATP-binding protein [Puia sp.]